MRGDEKRLIWAARRLRKEEEGGEGRATMLAIKHSVTNKSLFVCTVLSPFMFFS